MKISGIFENVLSGTYRWCLKQLLDVFYAFMKGEIETTGIYIWAILDDWEGVCSTRPYFLLTCSIFDRFSDTSPCLIYRIVESTHLHIHILNIMYNYESKYDKDSPFCDLCFTGNPYTSGYPVSFELCTDYPVYYGWSSLALFILHLALRTSSLAYRRSSLVHVWPGLLYHSDGENSRVAFECEYLWNSRW